MKKELPNQVFYKKYDNFYLFTEFDIIFNDSFYEKLIFFIKKIKSNKLYFKLENSLQETTSLVKNIKYINPTKDIIKKFYEMEIEVNNKKIPIYCLNHFIIDDSHKWEVYVSLENELSIIGCSNSIKSLFETIFKPYKEENLDVKFKIIGDMFSDENTRKNYISTLQKNYNFWNADNSSPIPRE